MFSRRRRRGLLIVSLFAFSLIPTPGCAWVVDSLKDGVADFLETSVADLLEQAVPLPKPAEERGLE